MGGFPQLKNSIIRLFEVFFPPACPLCLKTLTAEDEGFCLSCREAIRPLTGARCTCCALPFTAADGSSHLCGRCSQSPPPYSRVYAFGLYDGALRRAVHQFKFQHKVGLDRTLGRLMESTLSSGLQVDLVVPVPLHNEKLKQRCYNQALLLARQVAGIRGWPVASRLLEKGRRTPAQHELPAERRAENLRGVFQVRSQLDGEKVLLVDDVMTTGSTVAACCQVLKRAGAGDISVVVLARAAR